MSESPDLKEEGLSRPRRSPSLFGPIVLIAIGVYFLLSNLGLVSGLNWMAALRLWPLLLVFIGINLIVRQAPRPFGAFLSALVALLAVAVFGYVLLFADDNPLLNRLGVSGNADVQRRQIEFSADDIDTAVVDIGFGFSPVEVYALDDSPNLIEGTVTYAGDLIFDHDVSGSEATVNLHTRNGGFWFFNPNNWMNFGREDRWRIGLDPDVTMDLRLDLSAGSADLDLSELTLSRLQVDGGAGSMEIALPDGDYDVQVDVSAGSTRLTLPESGRQTVEIHGGAGSLTLYLPPTMEARVEVDDGVGSFGVDRDRFTQISGDEPDDGVWETDGYDEGSRNRVDLTIDVSAGSVSIQEP